jgi:hypothetical protein
MNVPGMLHTGFFIQGRTIKIRLIRIQQELVNIQEEFTGRIYEDYTGRYIY